MAYEWNFETPLRSTDLLLAGIAGSLKLAVTSMALAVVVGSAVAALRMSRHAMLRVPALIYIDFFRSSAVLVLILWCFFALPLLIRVELGPYQAALIAIGLQAAAYFAELARGAFQSIDKGQWEASAALGMHRLTSLIFVIVPQALRRMIPVTFNLAIVVLKNTSLAAAISFSELSYQASLIATTTYRPIETYTIIGFIYLAIISTASVFSRWLERCYQMEPGR